MSRTWWFSATAIAIVACLDRTGVVAPVPPAAILEAAAALAPHAPLGAVVTVRVRDADSVAVIARAASAARTDTTPAVDVQDGTVVVPVLGLLPDTQYELQVVAYGKGGDAGSPPLGLTTAPLPADLPRYSASGLDPTPRYTVFAAGSYGIVIDETGRIVWYRHFPTGPGLSFMAQPNGHYFARPPTPEPGRVEPLVEIDPLGAIVRTVACARGLQPRFHDLIADPDGTYWLLCDETRTMDLSAHGGRAAAEVTGTLVQRVDAAGTLLFEWSPFDHFSIEDLDPADRGGIAVNWTHGNSLDRTPDGDILVSFRSLGEVTRIDGRTGSVEWRLGGRANQFTFAGTAAPPFARQHSVRAAGDGIVLLDNTGDPTQSRAERYRIDGATMIATLERSIGATPPTLTLIGGSVQPLPGERALVSFGTAGRVEEYDAAGNSVWRIDGNAGYVFRAQRIRSLYTPGAGSTR